MTQQNWKKIASDQIGMWPFEEKKKKNCVIIGYNIEYGKTCLNSFEVWQLQI
jgi:hypothetical protein